MSRFRLMIRNNSCSRRYSRMLGGEEVKIAARTRLSASTTISLALIILSTCSFPREGRSLGLILDELWFGNLVIDNARGGEEKKRETHL